MAVRAADCHRFAEWAQGNQGETSVPRANGQSSVNEARGFMTDSTAYLDPGHYTMPLLACHLNFALKFGPQGAKPPASRPPPALFGGGGAAGRRKYVAGAQSTGGATFGPVREAGERAVPPESWGAGRERPGN